MSLWIKVKFAILGNYAWKYLNFMGEGEVLQLFEDLNNFSKKIILKRI